MAELPPEDLLYLEGDKVEVHALRGHGPVHKRLHPVVGCAGKGKPESLHGGSPSFQSVWGPTPSPLRPSFSHARSVLHVHPSTSIVPWGRSLSSTSWCHEIVRFAKGINTVRQVEKNKRPCSKLQGIKAQKAV